LTGGCPFSNSFEVSFLVLITVLASFKVLANFFKNYLGKFFRERERGEGERENVREREIA
jgi:hypothetical protein